MRTKYTTSLGKRASNHRPVHTGHWKCKDESAPDRKMPLALKALMVEVMKVGETARGRGEEVDRVGMLESSQ
jgi:hypothetical protein